jgi:hypothetical protein
MGKVLNDKIRTFSWRFVVFIDGLDAGNNFISVGPSIVALSIGRWR